MAKDTKKKLIIALMTLQVVFAIIFVFAFVNYINGRAFLNIGLPVNVENIIVMGFSILSMFNTIYELKVI